MVRARIRNITPWRRAYRRMIMNRSFSNRERRQPVTETTASMTSASIQAGKRKTSGDSSTNPASGIDSEKPHCSGYSSIQACMTASQYMQTSTQTPANAVCQVISCAQASRIQGVAIGRPARANNGARPGSPRTSAAQPSADPSGRPRHPDAERSWLPRRHYNRCWCAQEGRPPPSPAIAASSWDVPTAKARFRHPLVVAGERSARAIGVVRRAEGAHAEAGRRIGDAGACYGPAVRGCAIGLRSWRASVPGRGHMSADDGCLYQVAFNDGRESNMRCLVGFKCVISQQLPNMPKEYIIRIVFDRNHRSIVIVKNGAVIGGMCFRPFHSQGFAEIVFLAITEKEKHQGYGTKLMNHVKEHVKTEDIKFFLTYADNTAIGYFVKQGFTKKKLMAKSRWEGYIKDYVRSTLMECKLMYNVDYLKVPETVKRQKEAVLAKARTVSNAHVVRPPVTAFQRGASHVPVEDIPGVADAGWSPSIARTDPPRPVPHIQAQLGAVLKLLRKAKDAWPFQKPVQAWEAPGYYDIIKEPMDLQTMEANLDRGLYTTKERFLEDFERIITNCKTYNDPETIYVKCANSMQKRARKLIRKVT